MGLSGSWCCQQSSCQLSWCCYYKALSTTQHWTIIKPNTTNAHEQRCGASSDLWVSQGGSRSPPHGAGMGAPCIQITNTNNISHCLCTTVHHHTEDIAKYGVAGIEETIAAFRHCWQAHGVLSIKSRLTVVGLFWHVNVVSCIYGIYMWFGCVALSKDIQLQGPCNVNQLAMWEHPNDNFKTRFKQPNHHFLS